MKIKWNSLSQLKEHIENSQTDEVIVEFNGVHLITNKARYGIIHGELIIHMEYDNES